MHAMAVETAVETYDWVDTTNLSILVANFARIHMLLSLFDGDPDKWIDFLMSNGTAEELKRRMAEDPHYVDRLRTLVHDFSMMV